MPPSGRLLPRSTLHSVRGINLFRSLGLGVAFTFGFFLQFNVMISTFGGPFMRLTDALLFLLIPCLFVIVGPANTMRHGLLYFVVLFMLVVSTLLLKTAVDQGDRYFTLIFLLSAVFSFYFVSAALDEAMLVSFAIGTLVGFVPSLAVLFLQGSGDTSLTAIGLGVPTDQLAWSTAALAKVKLGGMWVHGNEAGHVYALATASALYLALRFRRPSIYLVAYGLLLATFPLTLNRAGLVAPTIGLIYCYIRFGNFFLYAKTAAAVICAIVVLAGTTNLGGIDSFSDAIEARFLADDNANSNIDERLMTNVVGVEVALENPFGIGYQERTMVMAARAINAVVSAHNGLISLSFQDGIAVPFLYIMSCIYLVVNRRSVSSFYVIMSAFTVASMFFEELVINQLFIFSVTLTICAAWVHYVRRTMRKMVTQKLTGRSIALGRRP